PTMIRGRMGRENDNPPGYFLTIYPFVLKLILVASIFQSLPGVPSNSPSSPKIINLPIHSSIQRQPNIRSHPPSFPPASPRSPLFTPLSKSQRCALHTGSPHPT